MLFFYTTLQTCAFRKSPLKDTDN